MRKTCAVDWNQLRSEDSVYTSFERLCSQVAKLKKPSSDAEFISNGDPDGGVDCYWKLDNSDIHAWQAKFFRRLGTTQWNQIDESVQNALKNYPKLTKYVICLPLNLSNSGKNSARQKWESHKKKWLEQKPNVDYIFHGHDEFVDLLSNDIYVGKLKYFFGNIGFTQSWFNNHKTNIRSDIGLRYSEESNVDLPIIKKFDALCKTNEFVIDLHTYANKLKKLLKYVNDLSHNVDIDFKIYNEKIIILINKLFTIDAQIDHDIKINDLIQDCDLLVYELKLYEDRIDSYDMSKLSNLFLRDDRGNHTQLDELQNKLISARSSLRYGLYDLQIFLQERICVYTRQIIVTGDAGMGKTHLFFDILKKRLEDNRATILLLGQWFDTDPLSEIPKYLGLDCNIDEFLDALDSHAEATGHRSLLLIDALNESSDENIWQKHLNKLFKIISKYKSISFAVSARSGYIEKYDNIIPDSCMRVEHTGFQDNPSKYVNIFFTKNNLVTPTMPFLQQEFSTPQFLFLLCNAMLEKQIKDVSDHSLDILSVYELYIKSINKKLCKSDKLDYDENDNIVKKGIDELAKLMASQSVLELDYDVANDCLLNVHNSNGYSKSLLYNLIQEGILLRDYKINKIRFVYERLAEHLIVREYLNEFDHDTIVKSFHKGGKLFKFFNGSNFYYMNSGIIDAILIQLPDKFCMELTEIIPCIINNSEMMTAILNSLSLRKPDSITIKTIEPFQKIIQTKKRKNIDDYFKALLTLAMRPNPDINANYLHQKLLNMEMADRDVSWSIFLHDYYVNDGIVFKYITWAQNINPNTNSKKQIFLSAMVICWFLTSSHKIIRDNAIMALIELMHNDAEEWLTILKKFENCNDPYVVANLYAVTYAIILTNKTSKSQIEKIALYIYSKIFANNNPSFSIFIRDYARRIIHYANTVIPNLSITMSNVDPPYKNTVLNLSNVNRLKSLINEIPEHTYTNCSMEERGLLALDHSLNIMSDFFRYTLGSNSNSFPWYDIKLESGKSIINIVQSFFQNSSLISKLLFEYIENLKLKNNTIIYESTSEDKVNNSRKINHIKIEIKKILKPHDLIIFNKIIDPYLQMKHIHTFGKVKPPEFDIHTLRNWISNKIFQFGWKKEYFGVFDSYIGDYDGLDKKYERIGKKYQWLAYYELLSKISDNYEFKSNGDDIYQKYLGTWQLSNLQTTDPTWIRKKNKSNDIEMISKEWFPKTQYNSNIADITKWLQNKTDVPSMHKILQVKNSDEWLTLHGIYGRKYVLEKYDSNIIGYLSLTINSYLCDKNDTKQILQHFNDTDKTIKRFEMSHDTFLGELYWHESIHEYDNNVDWFQYDARSQIIPAKLYPTTYGLAQESILTHNLDSNMEVLFPNKLLFEKMNLINDMNGRCSDLHKNIITFNTMFDNDHQFLLIKKKEFLDFLTKNNYDVIWQIWGEKRIPYNKIASIQPYIWTDLDGFYTLNSDGISGNLSHIFKSAPPR